MSSSGGGERRLVTVVFADLTGFTTVAEHMDPEDVHAFLRPLMEDLSEVVEAHGGTVVNWMGDGFMAVFGVPLAHSDDAERAVRAALACREVVESRAGQGEGWVGPTDLHAGMHTGEVLVVPLRDGLDLIGDTVNTASRLVGVAPAGCVLVGARTRELTEHVAEYLEWEPVQLRGKAEPVPAFQVRSIAERPGERPTLAGRTQFVGRESELEWLLNRLRASLAARSSGVVAVVGVPGVGKSRLVERFAESTPARVLIGRCHAYGERAPWHALADALRGHLDVAPSADPETVRAAVAAGVRRTLPELSDRERASLAGLLGVVLGLGGTAAPPGVRQLNLDLAVALRRFLSSLARSRPVVVTLEDVQWADPQVLAFLAWVAEEPWPEPVLFVCIGWPDVLELGTLKVEDENVLRLHALSPSECVTMVQGLLPGDLPASVREEILRRSGGNPLFLEETVHLLREQGALEDLTGGWALSGDARTIPETVHLVIAARIDGLPEDERRALRDASVAGEVFWDRLLRAIGWGEEIDGLLERLVERELVRPLEDEAAIPDARAFGFKHALIREVAYGTLPRADRAAKHLAIAGWLRAGATGGEEPVELLASHYAHAVALQPGLPAHTVRLAVDYLRRAGDRAGAQLAWREAEAQYAHALTVGETLDPSPLHVDGELVAETRLAHAEALANLGRYEEARAEGAAILELATSADRPDWHARALLVLGRAESDVPNEAVARELLSRAMTIARAHEDRRVEAIGLYETAFTWRFEDPERNQDWLQRAAEAFAALGDAAWELRCVQDLAWMATPHGEERFRPLYDRLETLSADRGARALGALRRAWGFARFYAGDLAEARVALVEAVDLGRDSGDPDIEIESRYQLALIDLAEGELDSAEAHADRIRESGERRGFRRTVAMALLIRARAASRRGAGAVAGAAIDRAEELLGALRAELDVVEVHLARAETALDAGAFEDAELAAHRFAEGLRSRGPRWRPYGLTLLGLARLGRGEDLDGAAAAFRDAAREGREAGNLWATARAAVALAEIDALQSRDPQAPPKDLPTPLERALAAEIRGLR
ncbi:MAG: adenylate/guanylate cyclase domain-containing protein, partial [Actinomycetota bacterium]